jgi:hypothetical protein
LVRDVEILNLRTRFATDDAGLVQRLPSPQPRLINLV